MPDSQRERIRIYASRKGKPAMCPSRILYSLLALVILSFGTEQRLAAYADPGSGAMIWQILVAGFVGTMFYWRKVTGWIRGNRKKDSAD